jgi:hypothetical protein
MHQRRGVRQQGPDQHPHDIDSPQKKKPMQLFPFSPVHKEYEQEMQIISHFSLNSRGRKLHVFLHVLIRDSSVMEFKPKIIHRIACPDTTLCLRENAQNNNFKTDIVCQKPIRSQKPLFNFNVSN